LKTVERGKKRHLGGIVSGAKSEKDANGYGTGYLIAHTIEKEVKEQEIRIKGNKGSKKKRLAPGQFHCWGEGAFYF